MKRIPRLYMIASLLLPVSVSPLPAYSPPESPFAPAAGQPGSKAVAYNDERIRGWATSVHTIQYGEEVSEEWKVPEAALGPAGPNGVDVVVLGRNGSIVLGFSQLVQDAEGDDFVVFENAFRDRFLELAFVEVSSDGEHFVRFPSYSLTASPIPAFGDVDPTFVHGLAGKYRAGFGTPFDLSVLEEAHSAALGAGGGFSETYRTSLLESFPFVDLTGIRYIRLIDIAGDGTHSDCEGFPIYDPYPTSITAGFDLDAVAVLNPGGTSRITFSDWSASHQLQAVENADTDKDNWSQYLEYLTGSNPTDPDSVPIVQVTLDGQSHVFRVRYGILKAAVGRPRAQATSDGANWADLDSGETGEASDGSSGQDVVIMEATAPYSGLSGTVLVRLVP